MTTPIEIEAAYSHASALGDKSATADEVCEELADVAKELQGAENVIQNLSGAAHEALGPELVAELKALRLAVGGMAQRMRRAERTALSNADKIEREYLAALDAAQNLEVSN